MTKDLLVIRVETKTVWFRGVDGQYHPTVLTVQVMDVAPAAKEPVTRSYAD